MFNTHLFVLRSMETRLKLRENVYDDRSPDGVLSKRPYCINYINCMTNHKYDVTNHCLLALSINFHFS